MADASDVTARLTAQGLNLVGDLIRDTTDEIKFYAFIHADRTAEGSQIPSNFRLRSLATEFKTHGIEISFVLVHQDRQDVLANAKSFLMRDYNDLIRNVFPTFGNRGVIVWVEPKKILEPHEASEMKKRLEEFLKFLKVTFEAFYVTSSENLPTQTACLNSIRIFAPVGQDRLKVELEKRGFHVPSDEWLSHFLDRVRKANFVIRSKSGAYNLTLKGLRATGSAKNRKSPDIIRALAIAWRGS